MVQISPSILSANHMNLMKDIFEIEKGGGNSIHVDIMDGHYVKNITFGPQTVEQLRRITDLPIDVHFEMFRQEEYIDSFIDAGANMITLQFESCDHPLRAIEKIKSRGCLVSLAFAPMTSVDAVKLFLHELDQINLMSVEPGFGGQTFRKEVFKKIENIKEVIQVNQYQTLISVDGGLNETNIPKLLELGVDNLIVGNRVFEDREIKRNITKLRKLINENMVEEGKV